MCVWSRLCVKSVFVCFRARSQLELERREAELRAKREEEERKRMEEALRARQEEELQKRLEEEEELARRKQVRSRRLAA